MLSAEKPRYEFSTTVSRRICKQLFPVKSHKIKEMTRGDKDKLFSLFVPLFTLSPYSARLCAPCAGTCPKNSNWFEFVGLVMGTKVGSCN